MNATLDLTQLIRPGDGIVCGQATGEPRTLTEALVAQRAKLGGVHLFLGAMFSETFAPEHSDHIRFVGIGGIGGNRRLVKAGAMDVLPCHFSAVPRLIEEGRLRADVVLAQLSPAGADGRHSLGLSGDFMRTAIEHARVVIGEVNDQVPYLRGDQCVSPEELDVVVNSSRPPIFFPPVEPGSVEEAVAEHIAHQIPDGAVIQLGIGAVPETLARQLTEHRDLGVHSGMLGDWFVDLAESGAITNSRKPFDRGISTAGTVIGSKRLYEYVDDNPKVELRPVSRLHSAGILAQLECLFSVNSAIEVDLSGQVNSETLRGGNVSTVGGQVDFVRGAVASRGGRAFIALGATALGGTVSRIVPRLADGVVTAARSDADLVVTEYGSADLRGIPIEERARRLAAIAHPDFRADLLDRFEAC